MLDDYQHILVTTDLSIENKNIVSKSLKIAKAFGAKVSLAHVVEPIPSAIFFFVSDKDFENKMETVAEEHLHELAKEMNIPEEDLYLRVGSPKHEILTLADHLGCDLIIAGNYERHQHASVLGINSNAILHNAKCDVMILQST